jgi:hypothetical protein
MLKRVLEDADAPPSPKHVCMSAPIQHIRLIGDKLFDVWRYEKQTSESLTYSQLVSEDVNYRLLDRVEKKGLKAKRTSWIGRPLQRRGSCETNSDTNIKVKFQCPTDRGVPYSFLNLLSSNGKKKNKLINAVGTLLSLSELCESAGHLFGKTLMPRDKNLTWLMEQATGQFLIVCGLCCVGVDCARQLIFDCALPTAMKLSLCSLKYCGILNIDEMRQIT